MVSTPEHEHLAQLEAKQAWNAPVVSTPEHEHLAQLEAKQAWLERQQDRLDQRVIARYEQQVYEDVRQAVEASSARGDAMPKAWAIIEVLTARRGMAGDDPLRASMERAVRRALE